AAALAQVTWDNVAHGGQIAYLRGLFQGMGWYDRQHLCPPYTAVPSAGIPHPKIAWSQACDYQEEHAIFLARKITRGLEHGRLWAASLRWRTKKVVWARLPQRLTSPRAWAPRRGARCWSISTRRATAQAA